MAKKQIKNKIPSKKYDKYEVTGETIKRKQPFCPKCGPGVFLAVHKDRKTCGKCGYMER
ncbi:30S ribosomal protein S27ae [Candidatus Woesearchaeota archaeon]|nr:30S ribosomal protein S27ae [Candidatus Woesearchaeota archaeon]